MEPADVRVGLLSVCAVFGDAGYQLHPAETVDGKREAELSAYSVAAGDDKPEAQLFREQSDVDRLGVAAFLDLLNGFNHLFPQIPRIGLTRSRENDLADLFTI